MAPPLQPATRALALPAAGAWAAWAAGGGHGLHELQGLREVLSGDDSRGEQLHVVRAHTCTQKSIEVEPARVNNKVLDQASGIYAVNRTQAEPICCLSDGQFAEGVSVSLMPYQKLPSMQAQSLQPAHLKALVWKTLRGRGVCSIVPVPQLMEQGPCAGKQLKNGLKRLYTKEGLYGLKTIMR